MSEANEVREALARARYDADQSWFDGFDDARIY